MEICTLAPTALRICAVMANLPINEMLGNCAMFVTSNLAFPAWALARSGDDVHHEGRRETVRNQTPPDPAQPHVVTGETATAGKKPFVEPAISQPVDVLEATTFFQVVESGGTGRPGVRRPTGE